MGSLFTLRPIPIISLSNSVSDRSIMSWCPMVMGSNVPGNRAILSMLISLVLLQFTSTEQVQGSHSYSDPVFHLLQDNRLLAVGHIAVNFHTSVNGAGVHDDYFFPEPVEQAFFDPVSQVVLPE